MTLPYHGGENARRYALSILEHNHVMCGGQDASMAYVRELTYSFGITFPSSERKHPQAMNIQQSESDYKGKWQVPMAVIELIHLMESGNASSERRCKRDVSHVSFVHAKWRQTSRGDLAENLIVA